MGFTVLNVLMNFWSMGHRFLATFFAHLVSHSSSAADVSGWLSEKGGHATDTGAGKKFREHTEWGKIIYLGHF